MNSETYARILQACDRYLSPIAPVHRQQMMTAVHHVLMHLVDGNDGWRKAHIIEVLEDINPIDVLIRDPVKARQFHAMSEHERVELGFEPSVHSPAYKIFWQRLWVTTFNDLSSERHNCHLGSSMPV